MVRLYNIHVVLLWRFLKFHFRITYSVRFCLWDVFLAYSLHSKVGIFNNREKKLCKQKFYHLNSTFPVYLVKCSPQRTTLIDCFLQNFYNRNGRRICDHDCQLIFADKTPALLLLEEFKQSDQGVYRYVMSEQSNRAY